MNAIVPQWCNKAAALSFHKLQELHELEAFKSVLLMAAALKCLIKDKPGKRSSKSSP